MGSVFGVVLFGLVLFGLCVLAKEAMDRKKKLGEWRSGNYGELGERLTKLEARLSSQEWPGLPFVYGKKKWITSIITAQLAGQTLSDLNADSLTGKGKASFSTIWETVEAEIRSSFEQRYRYYQKQQETFREAEQQEAKDERDSEDLKVWCALLGLDASDIDEEKLTQAFRMAAVKNHPDKNPGDPFAEARFKNIAEAYEGLRSYV